MSDRAEKRVIVIANTVGIYWIFCCEVQLDGHNH